MRRSATVLALLMAGCASLSPVERWGADCVAAKDPARRLELVRNIMSTGDERAIPVLIDCLESARKVGKGPDRVYSASTVEPNVTATPEFWALYVLTGKDFDFDVDNWRAWYELHRGRLAWDGGRRRFFVR